MSVVHVTFSYPLTYHINVFINIALIMLIIIKSMQASGVHAKHLSFCSMSLPDFNEFYLRIDDKYLSTKSGLIPQNPN